MAEDRCCALEKRVVELSEQMRELSSSFKECRQQKQQLSTQLEEAAVKSVASDSLVRSKQPTNLSALKRILVVDV